jgi:cytochrome c
MKSGMSLCLSAVAIAAAVLSACGGGGGGDAGPAVPAAPAPAPAPATGLVAKARLASAYIGTFIGPCGQADGAANADTGLSIYARSEMSVLDAAGATAAVRLRLDFYQDAACASAPLGSLTYGAASRLSVTGAVLVLGKSADRVTLSLASPDQAPVSVAGGNTVFGTAVRLSVPSEMFSSLTRNDLWLPEGDQLFHGGKTGGADFPTTINFTSADARQTFPSAAQPSPCAPASRSWTVGASPGCEASLAGSASGVTALVPSTGALTTGAATFTCSNGTWSAASNASCAAAASAAPAVAAPTPAPPAGATPTPTPTPVAPVVAAPAPATPASAAPAPAASASAVPTPVPPPAPPAVASAVLLPPLPGSCAAANVTWVVDGVTCLSTIEAINAGATRLLANTDAGNAGIAQYSCAQGALQLAFATCSVRPAPPPALTDPLQIAQQKNCIACHSVANAAESVGGVSMQVIAQRYRGNPPAAGVLAARVIQGSVGTFGPIPMPANPQISQAELAIVIPWILSQ